MPPAAGSRGAPTSGPPWRPPPSRCFVAMHLRKLTGRCHDRVAFQPRAVQENALSKYSTSNWLQSMRSIRERESGEAYVGSGWWSSWMPKGTSIKLCQLEQSLWKRRTGPRRPRRS
eukprot:783917-Pyramimonas_sp.AAC.1